MEKGHSSLLTEAHKYAEELEISLSLIRYPNPSFTSARRLEVEVELTKIDIFLKRALIDKLQETVKAENLSMNRMMRKLSGMWRYMQNTRMLEIIELMYASWTTRQSKSGQ